MMFLAGMEQFEHADGSRGTNNEGQQTPEQVGPPVIHAALHTVPRLAPNRRLTDEIRKGLTLAFSELKLFGRVNVSNPFVAKGSVGAFLGASVVLALQLVSEPHGTLFAVPLFAILAIR